MKPRDLPTPEEILQEAWLREQEAFSFYNSLASQCSVPFIKELLEKLKDEEFKHMHLVEGMVARLNQGKDVLATERHGTRDV